MNIRKIFLNVFLVKKFSLPNPPKSPIVNSIPLILVISITALKQAYEDILRHRTDSEVNSQIERVIYLGVIFIKDLK